MELTWALQHVLCTARQEADALGQPRVSAEHLWIAVCKLSEDRSFDQEADQDAYWLKGRFAEAGLCGGDLAGRLRDRLTQTTPTEAVATPGSSADCDSLLQAAEELAGEESARAVGVRHLLPNLILALDGRRVFRQALGDASQAWECLYALIGFRRGFGSCPTATERPDSKSLSERHPLQPGQTIAERYEIRSVLGQGGMGRVYLAFDSIGLRDSAIKVLYQEHLLDAGSRKRFIREAEIWLHLTHPHIVHVLDVQEIDGPGRPLAIVMDYCNGGSFRDHIRRESRTDIRDALGVAIQMCWALDYAHKRGVVHRDLKPGNILLRCDGTALVSDFGLAKHAEMPIDAGIEGIPAGSHSASASTMTHEGIVGTAEYCPPEQWRGMSARQSDVYSFGVTLYEAVCGQRPFTARSVNALRQFHETAQASDPRSLNPDVPGALAELLLACLAKNPAARPRSFRMVERSLTRIYRRFAGHSYRKRRRRPGWWAVRAESVNSHGWALLRAGAHARVTGEQSQAERVFRQAARAFRGQRDTKGEAAALNSVANTYRDRGQYRDALTLYERVLPIVRQVGNARLIAQGYNNLAVVYGLLGDRRRALSLFNEAITINTLCGNHESVAACYNNLGALHTELGEFEEARDALQRGISAAKQCPRSRHLAANYLGLGLTLVKMGELDDGAQLIAKARVLAEEDRSLGLLAKCHGALASVFTARQDYSSAEAEYRRARTVAAEARDHNAVAHSYFELGALRVMRAHDVRAQEAFDEALKSFRRLENHARIADCLFNLGAISFRRRDPDRARSLFEEGLVASQAADAFAVAAGCCIGLGNVHAAKGDPLLAAAAFHNGVAQARKANDRQAEGVCYFNLGNAYMALGQFSQAERVFRDALDIAEERQDRRAMAQSVGNLAAHAKTIGDVARMRAYARRSVLLCQEAGIEVPEELRRAAQME